MKSIAVIGGGITGVTTAYALAKRGIAVTLFEQNRYAGMETSFANGGQLSASNAEVWTHPSTLIKGIKWMLKQDAPLLVNPKPSWHKLSWFAEFNGLNKDIRADRIKPLTNWVNQHFPGINTRQVVPWAGLRPMMPDMMPKVGRGKKANVFYNTGHGHLGWTLSAGTADIVADIVLGAQG